MIRLPFLPLLTVLAVAFETAGLAQNAAVPNLLTSDFAQSDRLVLRSPSLGEDIAINIRYPALGVTSESVILFAFLPQPDVVRVAADLRRLELETSTFGVVIVSLEELGPLNGDTLAADLAGPVYADQPSRFGNFLADELLPLLQERTNVSGRSMVAGSGEFGRIVLQSAIERRGTFDEYVVMDPEIDRDAAVLLAAKITRDASPTSNVNLLRAPGEAKTTAPLDQLLAELGEGPFSIEVDYLGDINHATSKFLVARAAQMAIVPPY